MANRSTFYEVAEFIGWIGFAVAVLVYFVFYPVMIGKTWSVVSFSAPILGLDPSLTFVLFVVLLLGSAFFLAMAVFFFLYRLNLNSIASAASGERRGNFFVYLSIVFLLELILSTVLTSVFPGLVSTLNAIQAFPEGLYISFLYFQWFYMELILTETIPALIIAYIAVRFSVPSGIKGVASPGITEPVKLAELALGSTMISTLFSAYFLLGSPDFVPNLISLAVTSFLLISIYFRFGLKELFMASFCFNILSAVYTVTSADSSTINGYISTSVFLIILLLSIFGLASSFLKVSQISEARQTKKASQENLTQKSANPSDLWIRSSCPSCGRATFKLENDFSMTCSNCSEKIDRDYSGPMNIRIEFQRRGR